MPMTARQPELELVQQSEAKASHDTEQTPVFSKTCSFVANIGAKSPREFQNPSIQGLKQNQFSKRKLTEVFNTVETSRGQTIRYHNVSSDSANVKGKAKKLSRSFN